MLFDPHWFDDMAPSTDMVGPAKGYRKDSEQSLQTFFILQMRFFKISQRYPETVMKRPG